MGNMVSFRTTSGEHQYTIHEADGVWYVGKEYQSPDYANLGSWGTDKYPSKFMAESHFRVLVKFYLEENKLTQEKADEALKRLEEL